jgi:D-beta-D-heptose 7-phosphate kinase/D-beta-D-heptose 1-phosphate adenosyltransferase
MSDVHPCAHLGDSTHESPRPPRLMLVGDAILDRFLVGSVELISEAPVPTLHVQRSFCRPGGAGNVAISMAAMGARPDLVAAIGADDAGRQFAAALATEGVAADALVASSAARTASRTRLLVDHRQVAKFDEGQSLVDGYARDRVARLVRERMALADAAVISDHAMGACDSTVCGTVIEAARGRGIPVIVGPAGRDFGRYAGASVLAPSRDEASLLVGFPVDCVGDAIRAGQLLRRECPVDAVVVMLGDHGAVVVTAASTGVIPSRPRSLACDAEGTRDAAVAALAVAMGRGLGVSAACLLASAAASLQAGHANPDVTTWHEVQAAVGQWAVPSGSKVVGPMQLQQELQAARARGKRVGFTNGCFDILHRGHVALLEAAARECDVLVVGVNSDESVTRLKGPMRPIVPAAGRMAVLAGLSSVSWVCEFGDDTPLELIRLVQPDVLVKGADYTPDRIVGADLVLARGGRVVTPALIPDTSTTRICERIRRAGEASL